MKSISIKHADTVHIQEKEILGYRKVQDHMANKKQKMKVIGESKT